MGRKCLGLAFSNRAIHVAEVQSSAEAFSLLRTLELPLAENELQKDAAGVGKKLGQALKDKQFTAREAAAGIPAQWLMVKEKNLPPAAPDVLAGMLRIQAERDFSFDPEALAIDYVSGTAGEQGQAVVLAATLRERVNAIAGIAVAAGLKLQTITPTAMALSTVSGAKSGLYFGANGVELVTDSNGVRVPRHVATPACWEDTAALPGELRRLAVFQPALFTASEWTVWDDCGLDGARVQQIGKDAGLALRPTRSLKGVTVPAASAGAAALALARLGAGALPLDFLHSRLQVKPPSKLTRRNTWGLIAASIFVLVGGYLVYDWRSLASDVGELRDTRDSMKESVAASKSFIDRVSFTKTWYERRPNYLECMRTITLCFPEEGKVWTSNLTMREDMKGILTGRAVDEKSVLDVLDKMKASKTLADVKMLQMRSSGTKNNEITFSISFAYQGVE